MRAHVSSVDGRRPAMRGGVRTAASIWLAALLPAAVSSSGPSNFSGDVRHAPSLAEHADPPMPVSHTSRQSFRPNIMLKTRFSIVPSVYKCSFT